MYETLYIYTETPEVQQIKSDGELLYTPALMTELRNLLQRMSEDLTIQCSKYKVFQGYMQEAYWNYFGNFNYEDSTKCSIFYQD